MNFDSVEPSVTCVNDNILYSQVFLNSIKVFGLPNHDFRLKVGIPVMLFRNIDPKCGLRNKTKLLITKLANHIIETRIIVGRSIGGNVLHRRMFVSPPYAKFLFKMTRR